VGSTQSAAQATTQLLAESAGVSARLGSTLDRDSDACPPLCPFDSCDGFAPIQSTTSFTHPRVAPAFPYNISTVGKIVPLLTRPTSPLAPGDRNRPSVSVV